MRLFLNSAGTINGLSDSIRILSSGTFKTVSWRFLAFLYVKFPAKEKYKFKSQDLGQLVFYVNAVDEVMKGKEDNKTIGILLCKELDRTVVKSTIEKELTPISLSTYILQENLEKYFKNK